MNPSLSFLQPYPFQRLAKLIEGVLPATAGQAASQLNPIKLTMGEPQHPSPPFVLAALRDALPGLAHYPLTAGTPALRSAITRWANHRFHLEHAPLDPERNVVPVSGTREALFSIAQAVVARAGSGSATDSGSESRPIIMMPNPFYQIYEGAALLAGAEPWLLDTTADNGYRMDFTSVPDAIWARTQLVYICSPGNPTGRVMAPAELAELIHLAHRHDFIIAADECYSEIYFDENLPPTGLLETACAQGITNYRHCLAFHSLSKRSNLPGLRSGFVAGDPDILRVYLQYRTYHGCALSPPAQAASIAAWSDEAHVLENRRLYREKFAAVLKILTPVLDVQHPDASFYLWPAVPEAGTGDDETFTRDLYAATNVLVLPGSYLSREHAGRNPGRGRIRIALVAPVAECVEAAHRISRFVRH